MVGATASYVDERRQFCVILDVRHSLLGEIVGSSAPLASFIFLNPPHLTQLLILLRNEDIQYS